MAGIAARMRITPFGLICLVGLVASALPVPDLGAPGAGHGGRAADHVLSTSLPPGSRMFAFVLVGVSSVIYLWLRERRWDIVAYSAAEVGFVFCCFVMITGPIWGKPVWGTWWTWDPRLTFSMILWLIYVAYLMLRVYGDDLPRVKTFLAVLGILGTIDIPFIHFATKWWRGLHPDSLVMTEEGLGAGMEGDMRIALGVSAVVFTLLFFYLMSRRMALERLRDETEALRERVEHRHPGSVGV